LDIKDSEESGMDYVKPADVAVAMLDAGKRKLALRPSDLLIRGMLSGALLGVATSLAFTGAVQTGQPLVGAIIFSVGLISKGSCFSASNSSPAVSP
jgi:formate/nitrite transporter FocA (FNT family)